MGELVQVLAPILAPPSIQPGLDTKKVVLWYLVRPLESVSSVLPSTPIFPYTLAGLRLSLIQFIRSLPVVFTERMMLLSIFQWSYRSVVVIFVAFLCTYVSTSPEWCWVVVRTTRLAPGSIVPYSRGRPVRVLRVSHSLPDILWSLLAFPLICYLNSAVLPQVLCPISVTSPRLSSPQIFVAPALPHIFCAISAPLHTPLHFITESCITNYHHAAIF